MLNSHLLEHNHYFHSTLPQDTNELLSVDWQQLQQRIALIELAVKLERPDAAIVYIENNQHEIEAVGCFDIPVILNRRFNFSFRNSYSPQLLGDLYEYKLNMVHNMRVVMLKMYSCWQSAFDKLALASVGKKLLTQTHVGVYDDDKVKLYRQILGKDE